MEYSAARRVPHTIPASTFWKAVAPLVPPMVKSVATTGFARAANLVSADVGAVWEEKARRAGAEAISRAQKTYFDKPGLDTLTIRRASSVGRTVGELGAFYMRLKVTFGLDFDGSAAYNLALLPRTGYDALMVSGLVAGRTSGYFLPSSVRHTLWWDSAEGGAPRPLPPVHPLPLVRRFGPPTSLGDLGADIDDMYWAEAFGQPVKVVRVGEGASRRWIVVIPGTDHVEARTEPNPADVETNMEEELNIASDLRLGVIAAVRDAMSRHGLSEEEMVGEHVLAAGHSLGGMVAVALAAADPRDVGFTVDRVLTMGSPARRLRLRSDVSMVAVEHVQDIIPAFDGVPRRDMDQRVTYTHRLTRPRLNPLFYAHSSSTYTETVRRLEGRSAVVPWGRLPETVAALQDYLPNGEDTDVRVMHYYVWREVYSDHETSEEKSLDVGRPDGWRPVSFEGEITLPEDVDQPLKEKIARAKGK